MKAKTENRALLEIGTEEIPARFIPDALAQLSESLKQGLSSARIDFKNVQTFGTPRRLAVLVEGIAARSNDREDVAVGPPPKAAKDDAGNWTAAATGFAKAQNVAVTALVLQNTPKGERYVAVHHVKGQKTEAVLKELFPSIVRGLSFPKSMIWDAKEFSFARPIRWIVALYNTSVIRFRVGDVSSDRWTLGLLSLGGVKITVAKPQSYRTVLQGRCILVDPEERKKNILSQIDTIAKKTKSVAVVSPEHLLEVVNLTEYPVSILGHFPDMYLKLPREILVSVLKKHQKFFPMESSKGVLVNSFIGVRNGPSESQEDVREGYERVVNARFSDAQFFYEKDSKTKLADLAPQLSGVGFHVKLGSMWDKTGRVRKLTADLGKKLNLNGSALENADRAALLSKADLLTQMVGEFPELQGIAGRFYGEKQEKHEVAAAIEQHYWPLTTESALPSSLEGALVGLADKMDTLAANFSVGLIPSGSADPYGLRRMAVGVIRILLDRKWTLSIEELIDAAFEVLQRPVEPKMREELRDFFKQRVITLFGQQGYRVDEIEAVLAKSDQSLSLIGEKLKGLKVIRGKPEFGALSIAIKRAGNLLKQAKGTLPVFGSDGIQLNTIGEQERRLCEAVFEVKPRFESFLNEGRYEDGLVLLAGLKTPIDTFFKEVMVMVEDPKLRDQRLAVLVMVKGMFDAIADFSKLQV